MRCLPVLSLFIAVHLVVAAIDDEISPNEIPYNDPTEESEEDADDGDSEEVLIMHADSEYEEIKLRSMSKYIQLWEESGNNDESDSQMSNEDVFEKDEKDSPPKSSQSKRVVRKKRTATCTITAQPTFNCDAQSKYRTIDGSCNNLKHPEWGMAMGCQERLLEANYEGDFGLRNSTEGGPLPEPRQLTLDLNTNESHPEKELNHMSMFFGQLIAHDEVTTATFVADNGTFLDCCGLENDPRCANINVEKDDPFYAPFNQSCVEFPRAVSCSSCDKKGRKFLNLNTAYIDVSILYGSTKNVSMSLRTNDGTGKMISQNTSVGELLPNSSNPQTDVCSVSKKGSCFRGGDRRLNQHIVLTCLHTIFLREHNRIAAILKELNPTWNEETLYQETRRIVIAKFQVIIYKEYLPIVLSSYWILKYGLALSPGFTTYNDTCNSNILIEYSAAAFRLPHSSINTIVSTVPRIVTEGKTQMRDFFHRPFPLRVAPFGPLMEDTIKTPAQMVDRFQVEDVSNFLYRNPGEPFGLDLSARDIQRGRDTGLPTYVQMVKYCHNKTIKSFDDHALLLFINSSNVELLKKYYKSVEDIDLKNALLMENKEKSGIFGPTSSCVVALQFHLLKYGDRFYWEHGNQTGSFTKDQKNELAKVSLTQIICKNVDGISELPGNAMLKAKNITNENVKCKNVTDVDYSKWKEQVGRIRG